MSQFPQVDKIDAAVDILARQRDAFLAPRSREEKRMYLAGVEQGLMKAGMHVQALIDADAFAPQ